MGVLDHLEPVSVFHHFEEITQIPRGSGNVAAISDHLAAFARSFGYETVQDKALNVIVTIPATPGREDLEPLILQGHMDMVAVRDEGAAVDPARDPLRLKIDGDEISAEGTSLGGDDGIAIAYCCALMEDQTIEHPKLILLMTTDEETGMDGARALDPAHLKAKRLINIDSEEEGVLLAGCAGGARVDVRIPCEYGEMKGEKVTVRIGGLLGGHSGSDINCGRGNAIRIAGRFLQSLIDADLSFGITELGGGSQDNAIPSSAEIGLILPAGERENREQIEEVLDRTEEILRDELGSGDPGLEIRLTESHADGSDRSEEVMTSESAARTAAFLSVMPDGIQAMSRDLKGLVETSLNCGVMRSEKDGEGKRSLLLHFALRSSRESALSELIRRMELLAAQFHAQSSVHGRYPGWTYDPDSVICGHFAEVYRRKYGKDPRVEAIHAGVECGILRSKHPDLDCISFGPDLEHVHSTGEKLHISSAGRTWEYLLEVLRTWDIKNNV